MSPFSGTHSVVKTFTFLSNYGDHVITIRTVISITRADQTQLVKELLNTQIAQFVSNLFNSRQFKSIILLHIVVMM